MRNDFETGYLMHWGLKKGAQKENHKYVARIDLKNGKYRYFYTLSEYQAYLKDKGKDAAKKINDTKKKLQDSIDKGLKEIDKRLNKKKYDQIKKDLSTDGAKDDKKKVRKAETNAKVKKDLSTISAREKSDTRAAARKAEQEAKRKAHLNELKLKKEKGIEKKRKEREQLQLITQRQSERKMNAAIDKRKKEKENWLTEFRKKAKNLFAKDAKDSAKEDHTKHPEIPIKKSVLTKDQDMAAVNRGKRFYETKLHQLFYSDHTHEEYEKLSKQADASNINCASCSLTYDLRRRGYDVATPKQTTHGLTTDEMMLYYKNLKGEEPKYFYSEKAKQNVIYDLTGEYGLVTYNARQGGSHSPEAELRKTHSNSSYYSFEKEQIDNIRDNILEQYPEGSYGYLNTNWQGGGAHAQIWSIEDGEVVIRDTQWNEIDTLDNRLARSLSCEVVRIDNLELSDRAYEYATAVEMDGTKIIKKRK